VFHFLGNNNHQDVVIKSQQLNPQFVHSSALFSVISRIDINISTTFQTEFKSTQLVYLEYDTLVCCNTYPVLHKNKMISKTTNHTT